MAKYCRYCGKPVREEAKFCKHCGRSLAKTGTSGISAAPVYQTNKPVSPDITVKTEGKQKKKGHAAAIAVIILALGVFAAAAFLWPGFLRGHLDDLLEKPLPSRTIEELTRSTETRIGVSFIYFDTDSVQPMTATVNNANRQVSFENGIHVSFGENCLTDEPRQLEVRDLGRQFDGTYEAVGYDFLLDGEEAEFEGLVEITLPHDPELGDNVFLQYYNKKAGTWEILYAESNGNGGLTFRTDHFCTFGEFYVMVLNGGGDANGKVLTISDPLRDGLRLQATVHWDVLAAQIREGKFSPDEKLSKLTANSEAQFADRMQTILGNTTTGLDFLSQGLKIPGISKILGPMGQALTLTKFFSQAKRDGWNEAFNANNTDLAMLVIGAGAALPGPVGWAYSAVSLGYYIYSATDATLSYISLNGAGSVEEYAYRKFSNKYIEYDRNNGAVSIWRFTHPGGIDKRSGIIMLPLTDDANAKAAWKTVLEDAEARENRGDMQASKYLERIIDDYVNLFWKLNQTTLDYYLERETKPGLIYGEDKLTDIYKAPNRRTQRKYAANLKSDLYAWLKPEVDAILEKEYDNLLSSTYDYFLQLEQQLNQAYRIDLIDPKVEFFADSEYRNHPIGLGTSTEDTPVTINKWYYSETGYLQFTCAGWINMNCPDWLRILGTKSDPWSFKDNYYVKKIGLKPGQNTVIIDKSDSTPTPDPTATPKAVSTLTLDKFAGYWKQNNGGGMTVTIGNVLMAGWLTERLMERIQSVTKRTAGPGHRSTDILVLMRER